MAVTGADLRAGLGPVLALVARALQRNGVASEGSGAATLKVEYRENVKRVVQVYWTGFQAEVAGTCVGLHLEIPQPKRHWVEGYVSPSGVSWVFAFGERDDGDYQLVYYQQFATPDEAVEGFFNIASWYGLTACDLTWDDVVADVAPEVGWTDEHAARASSGAEMDKAVTEALKKSTIVWLRWTDEEGSERTMPVWFVFQNEKLYILSGERQQTIPGAEKLRFVDVILRWKGKNAQVADLPADVRVLAPGAEWDAIAEKIAEKRLNIPGAPEETARRWRDSCTILELSLR